MVEPCADVMSPAVKDSNWLTKLDVSAACPDAESPARVARAPLYRGHAKGLVFEEYFHAKGLVLEEYFHAKGLVFEEYW